MSDTRENTPGESQSSRKSPLAAVIMAAGMGKRMLNPGMAKVMYPVGGIPMIGHVVRCARASGAGRVIVIVGHQRQMVMEYLRGVDGTIEFVCQKEQLGTGHAVMQVEPLLRDHDGDVVVLSGDVPLLRADTVRRMVELHRKEDAAVTVLTALLPDPGGYGRVIRSAGNTILKIVEEKDASPDERIVQEINSGIYVFRSRSLFEALRRVTNNNAQGEYYLTDVFGIFADAAQRMVPYEGCSPEEIEGVNTGRQLEEMDRRYRAGRKGAEHDSTQGGSIS